MIVTNEIDVNFKRPTVNLIHAKQGDVLTRKVVVNLFDGENQFLVEESVVAIIKYFKKDKTYGFYDTLPNGDPAVYYEAGTNVLEIILAPQVLTYYGDTKVSVELIKNDEEHLQTFAFDVLVEKSENFEGKSEIYINYPKLNEVLEAIDALKTNAVRLVKGFSADGNLYEATVPDFPEVSANKDGHHVGKGVQIVFVPDSENLTVNPQLSINGEDFIAIKARASYRKNEDIDHPDATMPIPIGAFMRGVPYTLTFCGKYWLVDSYIPLLACASDESEAELMRRIASKAISISESDMIGIPAINSEDDIEDEVIIVRVVRAYEDDPLEIPTIEKLENVVYDKSSLVHTDIEEPIEVKNGDLWVHEVDEDESENKPCVDCVTQEEMEQYVSEQIKNTFDSIAVAEEGAF